MVCGDPATLPDWTALAFHYSPPQMMISVDKLNWNKHFQTSFRRARRGSSDRTPRFRSPNTLSLVGTLDENRFKEDTITRKNVWAHHKDISNVPLTQKQVKGNITTRYGASPGSILRHQDVQDFRSSASFPDIPHQMEVPRCSQTHRDQVGTSNWVEALQILTHFYNDF